VDEQFESYRCIEAQKCILAT